MIYDTHYMKNDTQGVVKIFYPFQVTRSNSLDVLMLFDTRHEVRVEHFLKFSAPQLLGFGRNDVFKENWKMVTQLLIH